MEAGRERERERERIEVTEIRLKREAVWGQRRCDSITCKHS